MVARIHGSSIEAMRVSSGMSAGLCSSSRRAVAHRQPVDHAGRGGDEVEVELAGEALLHDLQMQQAEEAAAEAVAERRRGFRLGVEARIVQGQLLQRFAQMLEIAVIDREDAAEHHRQAGLEAGQRFRRTVAVVGDGVADLAVRHRLDAGGDEADLRRGRARRPARAWA